MTFARLTRLLAAMLVAGVLAGCDKCGHSLKLITPSLKACGDNADPARS